MVSPSSTPPRYATRRATLALEHADTTFLSCTPSHSPTRADGQERGSPASQISSATSNDSLFNDWSVTPSSGAASSIPRDSALAHTSVISSEEHAATTIKRSASQIAADSQASQIHTFDSINFATTDQATCETPKRKKRVKAAADGPRPLPPSKRPGVSHAKKTPPNHIKRPRNAYILFRSHTVSLGLIPKEVEKDHRNISRIISHMWKSLEEEERSKWEKMAEKEKEEHRRLYPDYRYQPTTKRENVVRRNVKKLDNGEEECQEIADVILKAQGKQGVVVQPRPVKSKKRPRQDSGEVKASKKKRAKAEAEAKLPALETVFLHKSPTATSPGGDTSVRASSSPTSATTPSSTVAAFAIMERPVDEDYDAELDAPELLGCRRASSVPLPPPPFAPVSPLAAPDLGDDLASLSTEATRPEQGTTPSQGSNGFKEVHFAIDNIEPNLEGSPEFFTKRKRTRPAPILNTWQHNFCDDSVLPSPRALDLVASPKPANARPRTALPATPSSASFRGFFHPWALENGNNPMLISPACGSFHDLGRRASMAQYYDSSLRRPSFSAASHQNTTCHSTAPSSDIEMLTSTGIAGTSLFDEAARAAASNLEAEQQPMPVFDPALVGVGGGSGQVCDPKEMEAEEPIFRFAPPHLEDCIPSRRWSPRPSFSGSTLAAAARDWTSATRRRSRAMSRHAFDRNELNAPTPVTSAPRQDGSKWRNEENDESQDARVPLDHLQSSIEKAVNGVLRRHPTTGLQRSSDLVREILASLGAEFSFKPQHHHHHQEEEQEQMRSGEKASCRNSGSLSPTRSTNHVAMHTHLYSSSTARRSSATSPLHEHFRGSHPFPSPLQLAFGGDQHSYSHALSQSQTQHCN